MLTQREREILLSSGLEDSSDLESDLDEIISEKGVIGALQHYTRKQMQEILFNAVYKRLINSTIFEKVPKEDIIAAVREGVEKGLKKFQPGSSSIISYTINWVNKRVKQQLYNEIDLNYMKVNVHSGECMSMDQYSRLPKSQKRNYRGRLLMKDKGYEETLEVYEQNGSKRAVRRKRK